MVDPRVERPRGLRGLLAPYPITTAVLFTITGAFPLFLTGAYAVRLQDDLHFGSAELGYAVSAYFILGTIGANRLGPWIDRFGASLGLRLAAFHSVVSGLIIALVATSWQWLAVGLAVAGFGNAFSNLASNRLVAARAGESRQGIGFAAKQAGIPLASLTAGFLVSFLSVDVPWERTYAVFAGVAVVLVIVAPGLQDGVRRTPQKERGVGDAFAQLFVLAAAGGFGGATGNALAVFVVDSFESAGFSEASAARILGFGSGAAVVARILVGRVIDRRRSSGYPELFTLMAVGAVGFGVLALANGNRAVMLIGVIAAFSAAWGWPAVIYYTAVQNTSGPPATTTGFVLTGVFTGTIFGPPILGLIADNASFEWAWGTAAVMIGVGATLVLGSRAIGSHRKQTTTS